MEILLTTATPLESRHLRSRLGMDPTENSQRLNGTLGPHRLSVLHTGLGMVNTAYHLGRYFLQHKPDLAIQMGIAGAWSRSLDLGQVVEIQTEIYGELGAESPEGFLDLSAMGFSNFLLQGREIGNVLENPSPSDSGLPQVRGITVNSVHGEAESISKTEQIWKPEVESMEGAAFFQCCLMEGLPFFAFRGISNFVEPRNRANWKIKEAAESVQDFVYQFLHDLKPEKIKRA